MSRIGEVKISNQGCKMKIIKYNKYDDIIVEFQDKYKTKIHTRYDKFKEGSIRNPYYPEVCGIGYVGQGKYKSKSKEGKHTKAYQTWINMLKRCYDPYKLNKSPHYIDCFVCEEWHNFQNFAEWFYKNYYEIEGQRMELDKDILCKGNKIYSPDTCIIVPKRINILFTKRQDKRGGYPIGVSYCYNKEKKWERLVARCNTLEGIKRLDYFPLNKPFQAFYCYKQFKENYIKQVADEYKDLIPAGLYKAMHRYEVEIND